MPPSALLEVIMMLRVCVWALCALVPLAGAFDLNQLGHLEAKATGDLSHGSPPRTAFDRDLTAVCGPGGATRAGAEAFTRFPYLQRTTASSTDIVWTSPERAEIKVWHSGNGQPARVSVAVDDSVELTGTRQFVAEVSGLEPNTIYCYRIGAGSDEWQASTGFRTAPVPGSGVPVRMLAFGDSGAASSDQVAVLHQMMNYEADLGIIAGDVAYEDGRLDELEAKYFAVYQPILDRIPFFPAAGNHDYRTDDAEPFRDVFVLPENGGAEGGERWYSFDWGDVHTVVLDTEFDFAAQAEWLERDLAASKLPWTVVVFHRPPYSSGDHGAELAVRDAFSGIFEKHGVQLVVTGHDHHYERIVVKNGVQYIVTGGGGGGVRTRLKPNADTAFAEAVAHFVYLVIDEGALTGWAIDGTGQVFDTFRIPRGSAQSCAEPPVTTKQPRVTPSRATTICTGMFPQYPSNKVLGYGLTRTPPTLPRPPRRHRSLRTTFHQITRLGCAARCSMGCRRS